MPDFVAQAGRLGLDGEGVVFLREGEGDSIDWRRLGAINNGATYRRCPKTLIEKWWAIEDAWWEKQGDLRPFEDVCGEGEQTYRKQKLGANW